MLAYSDRIPLGILKIIAGLSGLMYFLKCGREPRPNTYINYPLDISVLYIAKL